MSDSADEAATRSEVCAAAVADAFADDGEIFASPMGTHADARRPAREADLQP